MEKGHQLSMANEQVSGNRRLGQNLNQNRDTRDNSRYVVDSRSKNGALNRNLLNNRVTRGLNRVLPHASRPSQIDSRL